MTIGPNSRNLLTQIVTPLNPLNGQLAQPPFVNVRPRVTTTASDDRNLLLDGFNSWASLAALTLGDARFWWIIADLSSVVDPFAELIPGNQVTEPSVQRLLFSILAPSNTTT